MRRKPLNPNSMQMIMENFKRYTEQTSDYGPLCLFEDGVSKEVSFYDHIHQLNESDESIELFLENWEKSADYFLAQLNEAEPAQQSQWQLLKQNPALFLSTQAWVNLGRFKDKAASAVTRVLSKIGGALQPLKAKSPKLYKFGVESLKGLAWMTAGILVYKIIQSGGNAEGLDQVVAAVENVAPDASQAIENISQAANVEQGIEALETFDAEARQAIEALPGLGDQIGAPDGSAIDGASDVITQAAETYPDPPPQEDALDWFAQAMEEKTRTGGDLGADLGATMDAGEDPSAWFEQAMEDKQLEKIDDWYESTYGAGGGPSTFPEAWEGWDPGDLPWEKNLANELATKLNPEQLKTLTDQVDAQKFNRSGRKILRYLYKEMSPDAARNLKAIAKAVRRGQSSRSLPTLGDVVANAGN